MELSTSDKETIEFITNLARFILKELREMEQLEKSGKDLSLVDNLKDSIKSDLLLEDSLYKKIANKPEVIQNYINFMDNNSDSINFINELYYINFIDNNPSSISFINELCISKNNKEDELIKWRVITKLLQLSISNYIDSLINDNLVADVNIIKIKELLKIDLIYTILVILNEYINNQQYDSIKPSLISLKYNLAFMYDFVLNDFLDNNFSVNTDLYWGTDLYASIKHINPEYLTIFKNTYARLISKEFVENIISYTKFSDKDDFKNAIISQIFIRASLLFLNDSIVKEIRESVEKSLYIERKLNNNPFIGELLLETYAKYEQDKSIPKIVLMR